MQTDETVKHTFTQQSTFENLEEILFLAHLERSRWEKELGLGPGVGSGTGARLRVQVGPGEGPERGSELVLESCGASSSGIRWGSRNKP